MDENYTKLKEKLDISKISYSEEKLKEVYEYCKKIYDNKLRFGKDIFNHTLGVANMVAELKLDDTSIYVALLHEAIRLEEFDEKEFLRKFETEILDMIKTIDKLSYLNLKPRKSFDNENFKSMFLSIAKDIRIVIIKLVDRLYNMQNIKEIRQNMSKESLYIYAPIAHRLGMSQIKSELEDIAFRELMPDEYYNIKKEIDEKKKTRELYIKNRIDEINDKLIQNNIKATIYGRPKHFYSIYKKMKMKNCKLEDLFDLLAIRIIVNEISECYMCLGIVHDMYKPMPGRFKDYIAMPKTNMYQSLHTTVFGEGAKPFEIQIRTWNMHKVADYGVAAHFAYKEKKSKQTKMDEKLVWLRQTLEMQENLQNTQESISNLKKEVFGEEVYVFTPKGDIKALPKGASVIDFAYSIHQKVAEKMISAKVSSVMVPLSHKLENTDIVEIVTSKNATGPNRDWLKYVKTSNAKSKITAFLKSKGKEENLRVGKEEFEKATKKLGKDRNLILRKNVVDKVLKKYNLKSLDEAYLKFGFGSLNATRFVNQLKDTYIKDNKEKEDATNLLNNNVRINIENREKDKNKKNSQNNILVDNINNCKVQLAHCCNPIPGDDIIGYITKSSGVTVHRKTCKNILNNPDKSRLVNVSFANNNNSMAVAKIKIIGRNSDKTLTDVLKEIKKQNLNILSLMSKSNFEQDREIDISFEISNIDILKTIIVNIEKINSVYNVKRIV